MRTKNTDSGRLYDALVVGGGPAGLSAAIYMARAKYRTLVLEKAEIGGQITITDEIVNYPGVDKTSGRELTAAMRRQAENFGAEFVPAEVIDMELTGEIKQLHTTKGIYQSLGVILAPGANPRKLGFQGEREFQGRGVAYCATCDGEFFTGMEVFVIGGGFAAAEEGLFLTRYAKKVIFIIREEDFTCAKTIADKVKNHEKTELYFETEITEVSGEGILTHAKFRENRTGKEWEYENQDGFGVFVFAGYVPNTDWITQTVKRDAQNYLLTDENRKTNLDGVYAAGDVCVKNLRQVVTAVADGAIAATSLEKEAAALHEKRNIPSLFEEKETDRHWPAKGTSGKEMAEKSFSGRKKDFENASPHQKEIEKSPDKIPSGQLPDYTGTDFFDKEMRAQLAAVFQKFSGRVILRAWLDDSPLSGEMEGFLRELAALTDRIRWERAARDAQGEEEKLRPSIELCFADGRSSGIHFHGVPGGHEINSFLAALYNVAGPGQEIEASLREKIQNIREKTNLKILVSLSCTLCPETVISAQKIASLSENVEAEMFDLSHFPELKKKYRVMSVPCLIANDSRLYFGKKNVGEILENILSS